MTGCAVRRLVHMTWTPSTPRSSSRIVRNCAARLWPSAMASGAANGCGADPDMRRSTGSSLALLRSNYPLRTGFAWSVSRSRPARTNRQGGQSVTCEARLQRNTPDPPRNIHLLDPVTLNEWVLRATALELGPGAEPLAFCAFRQRAQDTRGRSSAAACPASRRAPAPRAARFPGRSRPRPHLPPRPASPAPCRTRSRRL